MLWPSNFTPRNILQRTAFKLNWGGTWKWDIRSRQFKWNIFLNNIFHTLPFLKWICLGKRTQSCWSAIPYNLWREACSTWQKQRHTSTTRMQKLLGPLTKKIQNISAHAEKVNDSRNDWVTNLFGNQVFSNFSLSTKLKADITQLSPSRYFKRIFHQRLPFDFWHII